LQLTADHISPGSVATHLKCEEISTQNFWQVKSVKKFRKYNQYGYDKNFLVDHSVYESVTKTVEFTCSTSTNHCLTEAHW